MTYVWAAFFDRDDQLAGGPFDSYAEADAYSPDCYGASVDADEFDRRYADIQERANR